MIGTPNSSEMETPVEEPESNPDNDEGGFTKVGKTLVRKNHDLLGIKNKDGNIPIVMAAQFGHVDMVHFPYWLTEEEDLDPETSEQNQGGKLLTMCIVAQIYDVALDLVQRFSGLAIASETLNTVATRQSAFASGTQLVF
ncbi:hypothetical protein Vadar_013574 [Vaccinium darrowii]|uniref:Uncharacterized protein n=1 Tax=Vaccinium darrowii TaxID=229202 RepID=A0ACB7YDG9_9ERIC|nr:hypothetical protein Vadar_013574 [Vaccinium darrowii]